MKRVALLFVLAVMLCPAFIRTAHAESPLYTLSVSKVNGGLLSLVNLYGSVTYSETYDELVNTIHATLNCYGQGYTRCRIPSDAGNYVPPTQARQMPAGFANTVNALLDQSERSVSNGVTRGTDSKKVMPAQNGRTGNNCRNMYIYTSKWNCNNTGDGTVTISLYKTDASVLGM